MINYDEVEELACLLVGIDYDEYCNNGEHNLDDELYNKYDITIDSLIDLLKDLVKFTPTWKSPLTGELYQGFVVKDDINTKLMRAVIKERVEQ